METTVLDTFLSYMGPSSPLRGVVLAVATLVILIYLHRVTKRRLTAYLAAQAHKPENAAAFLRTYTAVWKVAIAIMVVVAATGSFAMMGLTVGFLGTILGWSLQTPIRGIAAWVMILLKRPFRVGDRIQVAGITGDVYDIQLNHVMLTQVGGTVQGEEKSGRGILVPNAMLFGENIINYNYFATDEAAAALPASKLMLSEVLVRLTFGSDYEFAKALCVEAARQAVAELGDPTDEPPFTRVEFMAWGIVLRVRYKTTPSRRQEASSRVTELIWQAFAQHRDRVSFCVPVEAMDVAPPAGETPPPMAPGAPSR